MVLRRRSCECMRTSNTGASPKRLPCPNPSSLKQSLLALHRLVPHYGYFAVSQLVPAIHNLSRSGCTFLITSRTDATSYRTFDAPSRPSMSRLRFPFAAVDSHLPASLLGSCLPISPHRSCLPRHQDIRSHLPLLFQDRAFLTSIFRVAPADLVRDHGAFLYK